MKKKKIGKKKYNNNLKRSGKYKKNKFIKSNKIKLFNKNKNSFAGNFCERLQFPQEPRIYIF